MAVAKLVADFDYTDAELLALWREASAKLAAGAEEVEILGKKMRRSRASEIQDQIAYYEQRVNRASGRSRMTYSRFRRDP